MRTSRFWCNHLSLLLSFPFCLLSLLSPFILLSCIRSSFARFFVSLLLPFFFHPIFYPFPLSHIPLFIRSFCFPSAPYKYMGGYEAKVRKIDRKVTFFL
ncbi:hypothetical protein HMPREF9999_00556 [Alloprevotella sp. oral taxon 473 str. F0040]|nr:hypothetical protein HMPREF9999_00556 [Alloprevotella sp. oral taxon 473 str. F0040]